MRRTYIYNPVGIDTLDPPVGVERGILSRGDRVRIIPKGKLGSWHTATTFGKHTYIETMKGEFAGMVKVASLVKQFTPRRERYAGLRYRRLPRRCMGNPRC